MYCKNWLLFFTFFDTEQEVLISIKMVKSMEKYKLFNTQIKLIRYSLVLFLYINIHNYFFSSFFLNFYMALYNLHLLFVIYWFLRKNGDFVDFCSEFFLLITFLNQKLCVKDNGRMYWTKLGNIFTSMEHILCPSLDLKYSSKAMCWRLAHPLLILSGGGENTRGQDLVKGIRFIGGNIFGVDTLIPCL